MKLHLNAVGKTDTGKKRKKNEDNFLIDATTGLLIVADGMGGHVSGEVASQLAVNLTSEQLKLALRTGHVAGNYQIPGRDDLDSKTLMLGNCVKFSNQAIYEAGHGVDESHRMGTTVVAALWMEDKIGVAHVGDSRLYIVRQDDITQCTNDHSFIQEQIDRGLLKPEEAEKSHLRNMLTRSVGVREDVDVEIKEIEVSENDVILLCSDGLTKMMDDDQIVSVISEFKDPETIAEELIKRSNEAGGLDNITVIVGRVEANPSLKNRVKSFLQLNRQETSGK